MGAPRTGRFYARHPQTVVISRHDALLFCRGGEVVRAPGVDGQAASQLLQRLAVPMAGRELAAAVKGGELRALGGVLPELVDRGMVVEDRSAASIVTARDALFANAPGYSFAPRPGGCEHLVVALTGSVISGLMAPVILSLGYARFYAKADVIVTEAARSFVQPELFEYYGVRTWTDPFARREGMPVPHILLGKGASVVLAMPATAHAIARMASGACSDLLSLVAAATEAPVVVAPCMNTAMWDHPPVRRNVDQLRADGFYVMEPTLFFEAAELIEGAEPLYGMVGSFWGGPIALMDALEAVLADTGGPSSR